MSRASVSLLLLSLVACSQPDAATRSVATTTPTPSAEPTPTREPTPEPTPTPSPTPAVQDVQIAAFSQAGGALSVRLHNPNESVGLIRAGFELAAIAADGSIVGVFGSEGVPGASCCTIYHLPPGGDFGLNIILDPETPPISTLELTITDDWILWDSVDAAQVTVSNTSFTTLDNFSFSVTGRAEVDQPGPFNVWVIAFFDSAEGELVATGGIDCLTGGGARAFEIQSFSRPVAGMTLRGVVAYPTTVEGYGDIDTPPGC